MKPYYSGDSYDIVKQSLLRWLSSIGPWATHPMFTEPVTPEQAKTFANLLGSPLLSIETLVDGIDRAAYLEPAYRCHKHVFLDPDTGIRIKPIRGKKAPNYIFGFEVMEIVNARPDKLTLVFDQSLAYGSERQGLKDKLSVFAGQGIQAVAYVSHACFVLLGRNGSLVEEAFEIILRDSHIPRSRFFPEEL